MLYSQVIFILQISDKNKDFVEIEAIVNSWEQNLTDTDPG
jgi:hypothetical protein